MGNAVAVTDQSFQLEVLDSQTPVLADFWAAWCGPCRAVGPMVEEIAAEYKGKLKVVKIDVDESTDVAARYRIQGVVLLRLDRTGAAARAGLRGSQETEDGEIVLGDILTAVDGEMVKTVDDLQSILDRHKVGDRVSLEYTRDGKPGKAAVTLQALR